MARLSLLDIKGLNYKRRNDNKTRKKPLPPYCYTAQWYPDKEPEYVGKLKSVKPSYSPGKLECIFDAFHYTSVDPKEKLFAVTDCLEDYEQRKQEFEAEEERINRELEKELEACGRQHCKKEQNTKRNARRNLNGTNARVKANIDGFFAYDKCTTERCAPIRKKQMEHFAKPFTMKDYKAQKGAGLYDTILGVYATWTNAKDLKVGTCYRRGPHNDGQDYYGRVTKRSAVKVGKGLSGEYVLVSWENGRTDERVVADSFFMECPCRYKKRNKTKKRKTQ